MLGMSAWWLNFLLFDKMMTFILLTTSACLLFIVWLLDGFKKWSTRPRRTQLVVAYVYIAGLIIGVGGIFNFSIQVVQGVL